MLSSGVARGAAGGHDPRAQALEGAPAQLVGANFKKKIRHRQIRGPDLLLFFLLVDFFSRGGCRIYQTGGGGADASIGPRALETLATPLMLSWEMYRVI